MIIESSLPCELRIYHTGLTCNSRLESSYHHCNWRNTTFFEDIPVYPKNKMNMIRHHNKTQNLSIRIMLRNALHFAFDNQTNRRKKHSVVFYFPQQLTMAIDTNGYEIIAIIVPVPFCTRRRDAIFVHKQFVRCHDFCFSPPVETQRAASPGRHLHFFRHL